jgi:Zn-dependent alcohol dehydrogenase
MPNTLLAELTADSPPAIEIPSERSVVGSYYGSADPAETIPRLVELIRSGRFGLADMVSHFIDLDGVQEAFDRLRRGQGDRSVVVDPALAGVEVPSAP